MNERLARLSEALAAAADARHMSTTDVWGRAWDDFERELVDRLLKCGPEDDGVRYRLQVAVETARHVRRTIEHEGRRVDALQKDIDLIEGRKPYAVA